MFSNSEKLFFENVIIPINQKSNYLLFFSARKNGDNKGKKEQIKLDKERAFDLVLQYVDQDTKRRRGNLTFRVHYILEKWYTQTM